MSVFVSESLKTTLKQEIEFVPYRNCTISAIKIKISMIGAPLGTFTLSFKKGDNVIASKSFTSADIKSDLSTTDNNAWIWKALNFNDFTIKAGLYTLELTAADYTQSESNQIGWIRDYESVFNERSEISQERLETPFCFRIYELLRQDLIK